MIDHSKDNCIERGLFVTFEGGDGAGKSTHLHLVAEALRARGQEVVCLREPGGTAIGEQLREIVLDSSNRVMCDECELLIYEAARAQLVSQVIAPALDRKAVVLCDRFMDSTIAYQVYGRGLDRAFTETANAFVCQGVQPDRTIVMMTGGDAHEGIERATLHKSADRLESAGFDFHQRVNDAYLVIAAEHPERVRLVVSDETKERTVAKVFDQLADLFPWMGDADICNEAYFNQLVLSCDDEVRS